MMRKILIIEDELPNIRRLEKMLLAIDHNFTIVGKLQTVRDSITWFEKNTEPDIIFMDIRLTDGLSFEIFNHVTITKPIIFTTAYDEYALRAFEVNGIDYLLKPLEEDRLERSLKKALSLLGPADDQSILQLLKKMQDNKPIYRTRFLIPYRDTFVLLKEEEIAYFTSENRATYLITHSAARYLVDYTLETLEKELNPESFFRVSRQFIVSLQSITGIQQYFNSQLKIELAPTTEEGILMSRERSNQLKKWLDHSPKN